MEFEQCRVDEVSRIEQQGNRLPNAVVRSFVHLSTHHWRWWSLRKPDSRAYGPQPPVLMKERHRCQYQTRFFNFQAASPRVPSLARSRHTATNDMTSHQHSRCGDNTCNHDHGTSGQADGEEDFHEFLEETHPCCQKDSEAKAR